MNLLFAINRGFADLFCKCAKTILKNGGEDQYAAYILHSDLEEDAQAAIQAYVGAKMRCSFIPVDPALFDGFPETSRYPRQIYYRLAAPLLLPDTLDRILYLDVDTVIINPLKELYDMDFEGAYYIACTHTQRALSLFNQTRLGVEEDVPYINTGVMVLNLPALRKNLCMEDIRDYANAKKKVFILPDQDIITGLYGSKIKLADTMRYNLSDRILSFYNADPRHEKLNLDWIRKNTSVIHYCGKNKPWKDNYLGVLDVFYNELISG